MGGGGRGGGGGGRESNTKSEQTMEIMVAVQGSWAGLVEA